MPNTNWSLLTPLQLGRYAEYYAAMEFMSYGYEVYTPELDDHGVDFIVRKPGGEPLEVQVKSTRGNYVFVYKDKMPLDDSHLVCYVPFIDGKLPDLYIIPATAWLHPQPPLVEHNYDEPGRVSKAEWGISYSQTSLDKLAPYKAENYFK